MNKTMEELMEAYQNGEVLSIRTDGARIQAIILNRRLKAHRIEVWVVTP